GTVSIRSRFQQDMIDASSGPVQRISRNPELLCDLVGSRETDPIDIFRQRVRIGAHLLDRLLAISLEDSHRTARAHTVAMQEQHDLANLFCLAPCSLNPLPAFGAD